MRSPTPLICFAAALALAFAFAPASRALPFDSTAVEVVQFTDYECAFCGSVEPTMSELRRIYGPALRVLIKHQPLPLHLKARAAAEAAEAAREQGRFEAMHERLVANPQALAPADLVAHASALGLDLERFKRDLASSAIKDRVQRDIDIANAVGATGTPVFFINGKNLRGLQPLEKLKEIIDQEIADATRAGRRGDSWISDRLSVNNPALWGYLRGGQVPPKAAPSAPPIDTAIYKVKVDPKLDAIDGPADALITLVEFLDFQCPFCKKLEPTMVALMERYRGKIRRVVKHNPLSFHEGARPAAAAAICAQAQGRYWQMHARLFDDPSKLDRASLLNRASVLELDLAKFERCLASPSPEARLKADIALAGKVGASGTPNTFINGRKLTGSKSLEEFTAIIDAELVRAEQRLAEGVKASALYDDLISDGQSLSLLDAEVFKFKDSPQTPILGNPRAKIRITVFSDLQCPFCSRLHGPFDEVVKRYKGKVAIAWKHFPLTFHKDAVPAAKAAACAHEQKKFWEAAADLFGLQKDLPAAIPRLPERIGLDLNRFASCMNRDAQQPHIESDLAEGQAAGVRGTPTVFFQGRKFSSPGGYSVETFSAVIDALLAGREP